MPQPGDLPPPPPPPAVPEVSKAPTSKPLSARNFAALTDDPFIGDVAQTMRDISATTAQEVKQNINLVVDTAVGFTNVGSAYEAIVGTTITGQELTGLERGLAGASVAFAPLAVVTKIAKVGKGADNVVDAAKAVKHNDHHAIPKFLGGADSKRNIISIPEEVHKNFHSDLAVALKAKFGLPVGTKKGSTDAWKIYFTANPGKQKEAMAIVLDVSLKHGYDIFNQALKSLKTPGMVNWYK